MKKIFFILFIVFISSCSDKLTNSKAEKIFKDCVQQGKYFETKPLLIGNISSYLFKNEDVELYTKLKNEGLITMEKKRNKYNIILTDKAKKYISETYTDYGFNFAKVIIFYYGFEKIKEIYENPSNNTAEVKIIIKKENETPFMLLNNDDFPENKIVTFKYRKTNNGWKLCD